MLSKFIYAAAFAIIGLLTVFLVYQNSYLNSSTEKIEMLTEKISKVQSNNYDLERALTNMQNAYANTEMVEKDTDGKLWKKMVSDSGVRFSLRYPLDWELKSDSFIDAKGNKVGELSPGMVELKRNEPCFPQTDLRSVFYIDTVMQQTVFIGNYSGELLILKTRIDRGSGDTPDVWYPNAYCIRAGNTALYITFYENGPKPTREKIYTDIIKSLHVEQ